MNSDNIHHRTDTIGGSHSATAVTASVDPLCSSILIPIGTNLFLTVPAHRLPSTLVTATAPAVNANESSQLHIWNVPQHTNAAAAGFGSSVPQLNVQLQHDLSMPAPWTYFLSNDQMLISAPYATSVPAALSTHDQSTLNGSFSSISVEPPTTTQLSTSQNLTLASTPSSVMSCPPPSYMPPPQPHYGQSGVPQLNLPPNIPLQHRRLFDAQQYNLDTSISPLFVQPTLSTAAPVQQQSSRTFNVDNQQSNLSRKKNARLGKKKVARKQVHKMKFDKFESSCAAADSLLPPLPRERSNSIMRSDYSPAAVGSIIDAKSGNATRQLDEWERKQLELFLHKVIQTSKQHSENCSTGQSCCNVQCKSGIISSPNSVHVNPLDLIDMANKWEKENPYLGDKLVDDTKKQLFRIGSRERHYSSPARFQVVNENVKESSMNNVVHHTSTPTIEIEPDTHISTICVDILPPVPDAKVVEDIAHGFSEEIGNPTGQQQQSGGGASSNGHTSYGSSVKHRSRYYRDHRPRAVRSNQSVPTSTASRRTHNPHSRHVSGRSRTEEEYYARDIGTSTRHAESEYRYGYASHRHQYPHYQRQFDERIVPPTQFGSSDAGYDHHFSSALPSSTQYSRPPPTPLRYTAAQRPRTPEQCVSGAVGDCHMTHPRPNRSGSCSVSSRYLGTPFSKIKIPAVVLNQQQQQLQTEQQFHYQQYKPRSNSSTQLPQKFYNVHSQHPRQLGGTYQPPNINFFDAMTLNILNSNHIDPNQNPSFLYASRPPSTNSNYRAANNNIPHSMEYMPEMRNAHTSFVPADIDALAAYSQEYGNSNCLPAVEHLDSSMGWKAATEILSPKLHGGAIPLNLWSCVGKSWFAPPPMIESHRSVLSSIQSVSGGHHHILPVTIQPPATFLNAGPYVIDQIVYPSMQGNPPGGTNYHPDANLATHVNSTDVPFVTSSMMSPGGLYSSSQIYPSSESSGVELSNESRLAYSSQSSQPGRIQTDGTVSSGSLTPTASWTSFADCGYASPVSRGQLRGDESLPADQGAEEVKSMTSFSMDEDSWPELPVLTSCKSAETNADPRTLENEELSFETVLGVSKSDDCMLRSCDLTSGDIPPRDDLIYSEGSSSIWDVTSHKSLRGVRSQSERTMSALTDSEQQDSSYDHCSDVVSEMADEVMRRVTITEQDQQTSTATTAAVNASEHNDSGVGNRDSTMSSPESVPGPDDYPPSDSGYTSEGCASYQQQGCMPPQLGITPLLQHHAGTMPPFYISPFTGAECCPVALSDDNESINNGSNATVTTSSNINYLASCNNAGYMFYARAGTGNPPVCNVTGAVGTGLNHMLPMLHDPMIDQLSKQIWLHYLSNRQPDEMFQRKIQLRTILLKATHDALAHHNKYRECDLYIVGSSINGFGSRKSDLDLCLVLSPRDIDQRTHALDALTAVYKEFAQHKLVRSLDLIFAKTPILRVFFNPPFNDFSVDLNANNLVGIRNSNLLFYYANWDERVKPLILVVKEWAKRSNINDSHHCTLSSYSLELMVIHYLQCGCTPPVLPSLQKLYPNKFHYKVMIDQIKYHEVLTPPPDEVFPTKNELSLGDLFLGFLEYFAYKFDYSRDAISVRLGSKTTRQLCVNGNSPYNQASQWRCICIEEPFNQSNTARACYDERAFNFVKQTFQRSYDILKTYRNLNILMANTQL